uniref:Uncharacterized protein n=1 Tax=Ditylenchus dipsaci TaxID=166011 RepID=A0A915DZG2_9BILA
MFPWLPFLTFPSQTKTSKTRNRRRLRKVHREPALSQVTAVVGSINKQSAVHCIGSILRIEYISHPTLANATIVSATQTKELEAAKLQAQQQQEQALEAIKARKRASFETSTEMLELFGGEPSKHCKENFSNWLRQELEKSFPAPALHTSRPSSSQGVRASPVEQTKSSAAAVTLSNPPAVRANRARQKAFQPSSAMLEMFAGGASEEKLDDARKPVTKKKVILNGEKEQLYGKNGYSSSDTESTTIVDYFSTSSCSRQDVPEDLCLHPSPSIALISEPGPEHFSEDTKASSSSSYSSEELSPTTIQQVEHLKGAVHSPPTRSNGHSGPHIQESSLQKEKQQQLSPKRGASSPASVQAIQLSDPGPELPFDEEEEDDEQAVHDSNGYHIIQQAAETTTTPKPHNYIGEDEGGNLANPLKRHI